ncbi:MAG: 23S rRNA (adenine(2503)-C(2))-methyltransferase RlmN [Clostridiales bacterium]|nr:23S rRNA (adenine(2503)-C(2))-methyltransferase RlmN [Clostridiales bacterium]
MKRIIQDLNYNQIEELVLSLGEKRFRAKQLYNGIMQGKNISQISDISKAFKEKLLEQFEDSAIEIEQTFLSSDGTEKYLFRLADGNLIEGVLMRYKYGNTQCISTQVGCRMGCKFCASTLGGLIRNLTSGEILSQILKVNALQGGTVQKRQVTNLVLMGSGEPFDNYNEVITFLKNVSAEGGINISPRNISLSTCGLVDKINDFINEDIPLNLTISLHNTTDEERRRTMPIANKWSIAQILQACENYFKKTGRRYIFEYSLIHGENADKKHANELIALLKGKPCHVNLIRLNEVKERSLAAADEKSAQAFLATLQKGGISATLRRQIGSDIGGACGQLRAGYLNSKKTEE